MIKNLALSLAAVIASATPAVASPSSMLRNAELTRTIEATGVRVVTSHPECKSDPAYGFYFPSRRLVVICVEHHYDDYGNMDYAELGDTLRHEAIHVAQVCNGGSYEAVPILAWDTITKYSTLEILEQVLQYPAERHHVEYEAFTSAYVMTNSQVAKVVRDFCF